MAENRFVSQSCSVEKFVLEQENKITIEKTRRDANVLQRFFQTKNDERKIEAIPAAELNETLASLFFQFAQKTATNMSQHHFEVCMVASFGRHLRSNKYHSGIMNDFVFAQTMKVLKSKQEMLKKQGKGNKPNESVVVISIYIINK
jgi:hypothetical protein